MSPTSPSRARFGTIHLPLGGNYFTNQSVTAPRYAQGTSIRNSSVAGRDPCFVPVLAASFGLVNCGSGSPEPARYIPHCRHWCCIASFISNISVEPLDRLDTRHARHVSNRARRWHSQPAVDDAAFTCRESTISAVRPAVSDRFV